MPNMLNSGDLIASIQLDLADNNAGLISAQDVRHNLEDTAFSINHIVASGDTNIVFPFFNILRTSKADAEGEAADVNPTHGDIVVESGIFFPNGPENTDKRQVRPWLGDEMIDHGSLESSSLLDDDHPAYYNLTGIRPLAGNMKASTYWINASGTDHTGLRFRPDEGMAADDATTQTILVSGYIPPNRWWKDIHDVSHYQEGYSNAGGFEFMDNSIIPNGKGTAKAWIQLNTSGSVAPFVDLPEIFSYHNISGVARRGAGKFDITFTSGTFEHNRYVAVASANGRTTASSREDFSEVFVGIVTRTGEDDDNGLRKCEIAIKDTAGNYQDSELVDIVFFGYSPGESSGTVPTVSRGSDA